MNIEVTVNGARRRGSADSATRLIDFLRDQLGLKSVREGCGVGECGACTVLLDGDPVCSCLVPAVQARGREIITIEGLEENGELDRIQKSFLDNDAIQCGFCTPGMVLCTKALLDRNQSPSDAEIKTALAGNICRCTGYLPIIKAVKAAAGGERR